LETILSRDLTEDPAAQLLLQWLKDLEAPSSLAEALLYYGFPLYRDEEGTPVAAKVLLLSPRHGVLVFGTTNARAADSPEYVNDALQLDSVYGHLYSRLFRNVALRKSRRELAFPVDAVRFAPLVEGGVAIRGGDAPEVRARSGLEVILSNHLIPPIDESLFIELVSTVEGAKGIIRPKSRQLEKAAPTSKGQLAAKAEAAIASFDLQQRHGFALRFRGPQRIRGLAGSGKTIVLAMKAAIAHLQYPDADILYTFYTKSLYQYIRRLITRFYRQFAETDCDWDRVHVLHAWGGAAMPGVYYLASRGHGVAPLNYTEAAAASADPFDHVCRSLMLSIDLKPQYDYTFIDEGQDFPISFFQMCRRLTRNDNFVVAYDELQTIFQTRTPTAAEIFGDDGASFSEDVVLYKCYRNPREILVCAHALGFGIYDLPVQMLENEDHWRDIGYTLQQGELRGGSHVKILRPAENNLELISQNQTIDQIVGSHAFADFDQEVEWVTRSVESDIVNDRLRPDDILVISVDDRNARTYLDSIGSRLASRRIRSNNVHADRYGVGEFRLDDHVTLSTVHKAKGNEAFMVYVVGVDALFAMPDIRRRNMLFTAMSRAKGWVWISGIGGSAERFKLELDTAKRHFPHLEFDFPTRAVIKKIRRDLEKASAERQEAERLLEQVTSRMSEEEITDFLRTRGKAPKKKNDSDR